MANTPVGRHIPAGACGLHSRAGRIGEVATLGNGPCRVPLLCALFADTATPRITVLR